MLIQIGPPKEPSDVVDLLLECHERIRSFAGLACRLGDTREASHDEIRDAAARVTRYFSEALPLHVADEEQSILPRLSGRSVELDETLQSMHAEHREHDAQLQTLLTTCRALQASPEKLDELRPALSSTATTLEKEFTTHLEQEERIILPAIRSVLAPDERDAILREVRARRDGRVG
jgi:iron-sulfur cluster repair protein YtfE (RIC family)